MAKLNRVTAKIFASNADAADIGQYGSALNGTKVLTSDIEQIQALPAYETGWRGAVISNRNYPTLQEMNGLQKTFSQQIAYLLQNGIAEWDDGTTYYENQFCRVGNVLYYSLIDDNTNNNPTSDTVNWATYSGGGGDIDIDLINQSKALETGNVSSNAIVYADILKYYQSAGTTAVDAIKPANYTIIGSPTISNIGIASGFSTTNYLSSTSVIDTASPWKGEINFTTGTLGTGQGIIALDSSNYLVISSTKNLSFRTTNTNQGNWITTDAVLNDNTSYYAEFGYDGTNIFLNYKETDDTLISKSVVPSAYAGSSTASISSIGNYVGSLGFNGSIDLNSLKIYVNSSLAYQACLLIPYKLSETGSKIVDAQYRDRVTDLYNQTGMALYYTIDTINQNFTLPAGEIYGMIQKNRGGLRLGQFINSPTPLNYADLHLADGSQISNAEFYNYMADLYANNPTADYFCQPTTATETAWTQPSMTANNGVGGESFGVETDLVLYPSSTFALYMGFDNVASTVCHFANGATAGYITIYNPEPINATKITFLNSDTADRATIGGTIYGSNDNSSWTEITTYTNSITGAGATFDIDLSSNTNYYNYYKIQSTGTSSTYWVFAQCTLTATVMSGSTLTSEEVWQEIYTKYGACPRFAIDTVNQTIRLPLLGTINDRIIKSYTNGNASYDIYADGRCRQTNVVTNAAYYANNTINLLINMKTPYEIQLTSGSLGASSDDGHVVNYNIGTLTASQFEFTLIDSNGNTNVSNAIRWEVMGYAEDADIFAAPNYTYICVG